MREDRIENRNSRVERAICFSRKSLSKYVASLLLTLLPFPSTFLSSTVLADNIDIKLKKYVRQPTKDFYEEEIVKRPRRARLHKETKETKILTNRSSEVVLGGTKDKVKEPRKQLKNKVTNEELGYFGPVVKKSLDPAKGSEIRILLSADTGLASISSSGSLAYYDPKREEFISFETDSIKVQIEGDRIRERQGQVYRVQVASFKTSREAETFAKRLRKNFDENIEAKYNSNSLTYQVAVGEFSSAKDAQALVVRLMNSGYKRPWISKDALSRKPVDYRTIKAVSKSGGDLAIVNEKLVIASEDDERAPLKFEGKPYRGKLEIYFNKRGRLSVINRLQMEDYIRGVVANELSPSGFPAIEAIKAQAVAARTYAVYNLGQFESEGYDLLPTALSQVYGGMSTEHQLSDKAVEETAGLIATYKDKPINALYTSTCGGRTESSEFVFTEAVPYLVSVACAAQGRSRKVKPENKEDEKRRDDSDSERYTKMLKTGRSVEPVLAEGGRAITRDVALLDVYDFLISENRSANYFTAAATQKEIATWVARAAELTKRSKLARNLEQSIPKDVTTIGGFSSLLISALYGNDRPSALLSDADADYILGSDADAIATEFRADVAALVQEGIVVPSPDGSLHPRSQLSRANVLLLLSRALAKFGQPVLETGSARLLEGGRLKVKINKKETLEFELAKNFYLFRLVGNEAFPSSKVEIIGGEKVNYHLDSRGRIDYIEIQPNPNGAASDRYSAYSRWEVRYTTSEVKARLADSKVDVGELVDLKGIKYGHSRRVAEMKVIGAEGEKVISGLRIRSALGLRETLFIISREYDSQGRVTAFRFSGRGWGHGVGMCQVGAYGLAQEGLKFDEILKTYYSGIDLTKLY
ncbi:MAG: SpoIID/LytB domain-containing protein [Blastocatellia bacterium]|nr:SpoIID/LytB domain-containing protein [Blastocatellia bacterium]